MEKNYSQKLKIFYRANKSTVIIWLVILIVIVGYWYGSKVFGKPTFRLDTDTITLRPGGMYEAKAYFDPDGSGFWGFLSKEQDMTKNAIWSVSDVAIAYVGQDDATRGVIVASKFGNTTAKAELAGSVRSIDISVTRPPFSALCKPIGSGQVARGEQVDYVAQYTNLGVPYYTYEWSAPENQKSMEIIPRFVFKNAGEKVVRTKIQDAAGSQIEITCEPLQVI